MGEIGTVVKVYNGGVSIRLERSGACAHCNACFAAGDTAMIMEAANDCGAGVGDDVRVELRDGVFLKAALIMYGVPFSAMLAGFFAGVYSGAALGLPDWGAALVLGGLGLFIAHKAIKACAGGKTAAGYRPAAVEVVGSNL